MRTATSQNRLLAGLALALSVSVALPDAQATPRSRARITAGVDQAPPPLLQALAGQALDQAVSEALSGYEPLEMRGAIVRLGPAAAEVLLRLARDSRIDGLMRLRAIEALGYLPNEASRSYLLLRLGTASRADDGDAIWTAATLRALSAFGDPQPLVSFLDHPSVEVREAAAQSLRALGNRAALPELSRRLSVERDLSVRAALEDALRSLSLPAQPRP